MVSPSAIFFALIVFRASALPHQSGWFYNLVQQHQAEVTRRYPPLKDVPDYSLIEACGGVGSGTDGRAPGACAQGLMHDVTPQEMRYIRLVFTPLHRTAPVVLAFHNVTANTTTYMHSDSFWVGDDPLFTDWNKSISLEEAHARFAAVAGKDLVGFVWRAMEYRCVFEPVFAFSTNNGTMLFVGAHAKKVCKTATMTANATLGCKPDCYGLGAEPASRLAPSIVV
jgi:hypothetical protein